MKRNPQSTFQIVMDILKGMGRDDTTAEHQETLGVNACDKKDLHALEEGHRRIEKSINELKSVLDDSKKNKEEIIDQMKSVLHESLKASNVEMMGQVTNILDGFFSKKFEEAEQFKNALAGSLKAFNDQLTTMLEDRFSKRFGDMMNQQILMADKINPPEKMLERLPSAMDTDKGREKNELEEKLESEQRERREIEQKNRMLESELRQMEAKVRGLKEQLEEQAHNRDKETGSLTPKMMEDHELQDNMAANKCGKSLELDKQGIPSRGKETKPDVAPKPPQNPDVVAPLDVAQSHSALLLLNGTH
ncbi:unnamed protein product [Darwinula stevensoni]|uniref:Uncharacterized protein n=1 Tax=Darwinula stevensoni TaxID=69355 RepID=A0A7R9AEN8_9CRUS|nr:unnamed protein product [Darwinula stevensoni]CAG0902522.1 unnamed protein product [Darwinula stevensoni]